MKEPAPQKDAEPDLEVLERYLQGVLRDGPDGPLSASLIGNGRSNPTYRLSDGRRHWVLRRPPYGHVLPTAHDMRREYTVIAALASSRVPVPRALHMCEDESVLGAPFYLMELIDGRFVGDRDSAEALPPGERQALGFNLVDVLADLHDIDPDAVGLGRLGRPDGYLERQLKRWARQWEASSTVNRPEVAVLLAKLERALPNRRCPGIVHGDVKLDNILVSPQDPAKIVAVLDWEMSTLGDTLTDLGILLSFWDVPGEPFNPVTQGCTALAGFPTRAELLARYAQRRRIDMPDVDWYIIFADVKIAVILEGINTRHKQGRTVGDGFDGVADMVDPLLQRALERSRHSDVVALRH